MRRISTSLLLAFCALSISACNSDPLGRHCDADADCGPGFDCYGDTCVQVCTSDDECRDGNTCYRYHCITPGTENQPRRSTAKRTKKKSPPKRHAQKKTPAAPVADATIAELRALRREIQLLRSEVRTAMGAGHSHGASPKAAASAAKPAAAGKLKPSKLRLPPPAPNSGAKK